MTALWTIGAVLACLAALALAPVRLEAAYGDGVFTLTGRAGPVPVKLFPREKATGRELERQSRRDMRELLRRLPPPVLGLLVRNGCRLFGRLARRARIRSLRLRYTAAGPDPFSAAMAYARAGVAMEGIARMVRNADLRAEVDFDGAPSRLTGGIALQAPFGEIVCAAVCFGIGFLRGYYRYNQRKKE